MCYNITVHICHIVCDHSLYPLWPRICIYVMWLTLQFSWSVCLYMHIYVGPPAGPCTLLLFGRGCDRPTHFPTGEFILCLSLHQTAAYALFLWGIWERETVIVSVACSMYYIMARFFVVWWQMKVDAHYIPYPYVFMGIDYNPYHQRQLIYLVTNWKR